MLHCFYRADHSLKQHWQSQNGSDIPQLTQEEIEDMAAAIVKLHEEAAEIAAAARAEPGYTERQLQWERTMGWHRRRRSVPCAKLAHLAHYTGPPSSNVTIWNEVMNALSLLASNTIFSMYSRAIHVF